MWWRKRPPARRSSPKRRGASSGAAPIPSRSFWAAFGKVVAIGTPVLVALGGLAYTGLQLRDAKVQFVQTSQQARYNDILAGLSSASSAAQINAVTRLVDFIDDRTNFSSDENQRAVGKELEQTLVAYVVSTASSTSDGLKDYNLPGKNWTAAVIATKELQTLLNDPRLRKVSLESIGLDHVDLHGYSQQHLTIASNLSMDGADLREAVLTGIQIDPRHSVNLEQADLTCADLYGTEHEEASLGTADLAYADLTGANLNNLDLSGVRNLQPEQVQHVIYNAHTKWPPTITSPPRVDTMQSVHGLCTYLINRMTGMQPGEGYQNTTPWPVSGAPANRHVLTVKALREGCLSHVNRAVDPAVLEDSTDVSGRTLLAPCPS